MTEKEESESSTYLPKALKAQDVQSLGKRWTIDGTPMETNRQQMENPLKNKGRPTENRRDT